MDSGGVCGDGASQSPWSEGPFCSSDGHHVSLSKGFGLFVVVVIFETRSYSVLQAGLKLTMLPRQASNP